MPPKKKDAGKDAEPEGKDRIAIIETQKCKPKKCRQEVTVAYSSVACFDHRLRVKMLHVRAG